MEYSDGGRGIDNYLCLTLVRLDFTFHADILAFIKLAIKSDIKGVLNVASTGNISLKAVRSSGILREMIGVTYIFTILIPGNSRTRLPKVNLLLLKF